MPAIVTPTAAKTANTIPAIAPPPSPSFVSGEGTAVELAENYNIKL